MARANEDGAFRPGLRTLALGTAASAIWPSYLLLLAYVARQAPWPRSMSIMVSCDPGRAGAGAVPPRWLRWLTRPSGWVERYLGMPGPVARQLGRAGRFVIVAAAMLLLPAYLLDDGLIAAEGRFLSAPAFSRFLILAFELATWGACIRLLSGRSALLMAEPGDGVGRIPAPGRPASRGYTPGLVWISRHRRVAALLLLVGIGSGDRAGRARLQLLRPPAGGGRVADRGRDRPGRLPRIARLARAIERHVGRWVRPHRRRSWAVALTSAMARRASARSRRTRRHPRPWPWGTPTIPRSCAVSPEDLADGAAPTRAAVPSSPSGCWPSPGSGSSTWPSSDSCSTSRLWFLDDQTPVTDRRPGRGRRASCWRGSLAWRYMSTVFALTLFHRMPDDPGVRFAVVTLCRYAVLAVTVFAAMGAIRLDMARIGVVLAALGVGPGLRPPGDHLQLRLRHHPAPGAADPHRRRGHGRRDHRAGQPHPHPRHDDRQRRQPEHDRPEPRVHHGQPGQLDAQGQDPARPDQAGRRLRDRPGPRGQPVDIGGAAGPGRADQPGALGDAGGVRRVRLCCSPSMRSCPIRAWSARHATGSARRSSGGSPRRGS